MDITKITRPARKLLKLKYCGAVIVAAGNASRMGGIDKVMAPIGGEPMIVRTVRTITGSPPIGAITLSMPPIREAEPAATMTAPQYFSFTFSTFRAGLVTFVLSILTAP